MAKKHCRPLPHLAHVQVNRANLNPVLLNLHALLLFLPNVGASDCKAWTPRPQRLDERNEGPEGDTKSNPFYFDCRQ